MTYQEQNLEHKANWLREGETWDEIWGGNISRHSWPLKEDPRLKIVCVSCGGPITTGNLAFYGYDVERVKCFPCQDANRKPK